MSQPARRQHPSPPCPYEEEEILVRNLPAGVDIAGTLLIPPNTGSLPAAILISGSGAHDRDETVAGHKVFLVIADHLARHGIAVLRYDDRGVGKSTGSYASASFADRVGDVLSLVTYLSEREEINASHIGLLGHSEGALIADRAVGENPSILFLVRLCGPAIRGDSLLCVQVETLARAEGAPEEAVARRVALQRDILLAVDESDGPQGPEPLRKLLANLLTEDTPPDKASALEFEVRRLLCPAFKEFIRYDPVPSLATIRCPVLSVFGSHDVQVPAWSNVPAIAAALSKARNPDVALVVLPQLNHLLQPCQTGTIDEYGTIEETIAPAALNLISTWILHRVRF